MKILVTGGCGFIGSNFIQKYIDHEDVELITNVDLMTYASDEKNVESVQTNRKYTQHLNVDICSPDKIKEILKMYEIDTVINFAAETHVDNSIEGPAAFLSTNVQGVFNLLQSCRSHWNNDFKGKKFVQISTDEVYGALKDKGGSFSLDTPYKPNSPYSATKASGDHLCRAFYQTYKFPAIVTNCCNNYGPHQHSEKLIPKTISRLIKREKIPVYGKGEQIREWIHVKDHCSAIWEVLENSCDGEQWLIGTGEEYTNLELVTSICDYFDDVVGSKNSQKLISFVSDRPGHDFRYAIDSSKLKSRTSWEPRMDLEDGMIETIKWYIKNS